LGRVSHSSRGFWETISSSRMDFFKFNKKPLGTTSKSMIELWAGRFPSSFEIHRYSRIVPVSTVCTEQQWPRPS
jgi:hypothetical protein